MNYMRIKMKANQTTKRCRPFIFGEKGGVNLKNGTAGLLRFSISDFQKLKKVKWET